MSEPCINERRFVTIEKDIDEIKQIQQNHANSISTLKENQAENRVYVKQILERIEDLKVLFTSSNNTQTGFWQKVIMELLKIIVILIGMFVGAKATGII